MAAYLFQSLNFITSPKNSYISVFSFSSRRTTYYNSSFHFNNRFNKYQILLLRIKMSSASSVKYVNSSELVQVIKDPTLVPGKDYLVVDVRDDDYEGGNIPNSVNSPSSKFNDDVNDLISKYNQVPKLIFTCALSQSRGPKCAKIYKEIAENNGSTGQEIQVLQGGFFEWQKKNKADSKLVENYDADHWANEEFL